MSKRKNELLVVAMKKSREGIDKEIRRGSAGERRGRWRGGDELLGFLDQRGGADSQRVRPVVPAALLLAVCATGRLPRRPYAPLVARPADALHSVKEGDSMSGAKKSVVVTELFLMLQG